MDSCQTPPESSVTETPSRSRREMRRATLHSLAPDYLVTETPVRSRREIRRAKREQGMTILLKLLLNFEMFIVNLSFSGMTIMVGVILVSYLLCTLPAIVVQELHSRGRSFDRVRNLQISNSTVIIFWGCLSKYLHTV